MGSSLNILWVIFCAILVSTMQAGFCCLESGLVRAKNSINVAIKNLVDFCIASLIFSLFGFALMFGQSHWGLFGWEIPPVTLWDAEDYTFFLFELTFCGTATTIVSGAVAERMSFLGYFITAVIISAFIYPIAGHWVWGGLWFEGEFGWLQKLQFHDFAGSTVVHSVGAWMSLAAILVIGPRIGRFTPQPREIDGHNLPTAVLGVFLLWFGWFGFNGGSTLEFNAQVPQILVNTAQGGAAGGLTALFTTWYFHKRPRVPLIMNGVLGGLVAVTAGCDVMSPFGSMCVGAIGGVLCTLSVRWLAYYKIDDPVGVVPAHLVCGIWGTMAIALFGDPILLATGYGFWQQFGVQLLGVVAIGGYAFGVSYLLLRLVNYFVPLRVTPEDERIGLNVSEHGASTAMQDLIDGMDGHCLRGDFSQLVEVDPETDVAPIARHYNRVLVKMDQIRSELKASHEQLLTILNSPAFPVVISEAETGLILFINERAAELFGFMLQEVGRYREANFWYRTCDRHEFLLKIQQGGKIHSFEARLCRADQETFWSLISGLKITYDGQPAVLFSFSDISTQVERAKDLHALATRDELTGLYNRRAFFDQANAAIAKIPNHYKSLGVLMLDIDHFKPINDRFGHGRGDMILRTVAHICQKHIENTGFIGRIGGEEFAAILMDDDVEAFILIAERLRQAISQTEIHTPSGELQITISIGLAIAQADDSIDTALEKADIALYEAKSKGRNRVECYTS